MVEYCGMGKRKWYEYTVKQTYPVSFKVDDNLNIIPSKKTKTVTTKVIARDMKEVKDFLRGNVKFINKKFIGCNNK